MIWLLLIYPLVGVGIWIDLGRKYGKLKYYGSWVDGFDLVMLPLIWPVLARSFYGHYNEAVRDEDRERTKEHERLIERIRKEPDPQLADWDREFNELAGIEEPKKYVWEDFLDNGWDVIDDSRLCGAPEFSRGGYIPTTTELNDVIKVRVKHVQPFDYR